MPGSLKGRRQTKGGSCSSRWGLGIGLPIKFHKNPGYQTDGTLGGQLIVRSKPSGGINRLGEKMGTAETTRAEKIARSDVRADMQHHSRDY